MIFILVKKGTIRYLLFMAKILIADDEEPQRNMVRQYLLASGFDVVDAGHGGEVIAILEREPVDLILLDLMMPQMDGLEVLKALLNRNSVPIIITSARQEESDKILGLELGADDYMVKPYSLRELVARIKVGLRRAKPSEAVQDQAEVQHWRGLILNRAEMRLRRDQEELSLTKVQFLILEYLISQPGRVFTRQQILSRVLDSQLESYERTIDVHIKNIRKILGDTTDSPDYIETVRGVGYRALPNPA